DLGSKSGKRSRRGQTEHRTDDRREGEGDEGPAMCAGKPVFRHPIARGRSRSTASAPSQARIHGIRGSTPLRTSVPKRTPLCREKTDKHAVSMTSSRMSFLTRICLVTIATNLVACGDD